MGTCFLFFLFLITICGIIPAVYCQCVADQQLSLLRLKKSLVFDSSLSSKLITWNSSVDCCHWAGVSCSTSGGVVGLDISGESISCSIDNSSSLFDLQHLESLSLASDDNNTNNFNGSRIPSAIGKLSKLRYLYLSRSGFSGQIPIEVSGLTRMAVLDMSENGFFGEPLKLENPNLSMLIQNLTELEELYLDGINISARGTNWCQVMSNSLPNLRVLSLSNSGISGPIDHSLAKLQSLSVIRLDFNNISAPVPGFFAYFPNLTSLSFSFCELQGTFPKQILQVPSLQSIDLTMNPELHGSLPEFPEKGSLRSLALVSTNFSGPLPSSFGNLKMLSNLHLSYCNFSGSIPESIGNLTQLVNFDLSFNKFFGPIDFIHWENLINLQSLVFPSNLLTGSIPASIGNLSHLVNLDLSSNRLVGQIDFIHWEFLIHLESLSFQSNLLSGSIPSSIFSPPLIFLSLSDNHFSGPFPELANITSNLSLKVDLSSNHLEGPIPMSVFNLRGLWWLLLSSNNFSSFPFHGPAQLNNRLVKIDLSHNIFLFLHNGTSSPSSSFLQLEELNLSFNKLRKFPDFLRNQSTLDLLDLSGNQIQGEIPNWIWSLPSLTYLNLSSNSFKSLETPLLLDSSSFNLQIIDLHSNQLQGELPLFLPSNNYQTLPNFLDYSRNNFSSTIPADIGRSYAIKFLSLSSNNLHGPIPVSICDAFILEFLDLYNNSLSGNIPECLSSIHDLQVLNLGRNNFSGIISNFTFPEFCALKTLSLTENQIEGQVPTSLGNCTSLGNLNLGNNQMTGPFPCMLKSISTLRVLILRSNGFYGSIGCFETNGTWPVLHIIDLAHNNFSGQVPGTLLSTWQAMATASGDDYFYDYLGYMYGQRMYTQPAIGVYIDDAITATSKGREMDLVKILPFFTVIDLSGNKFNGSIPKALGEFKSLYVLNLSRNGFTGEIPSSFGDMTLLESLDLSKNNLSGQIPSQLTKLTFLAVFDVSDNQLVGRIPTSTQFSTFPKASFEGNKALQGPPLTVDDTEGLSPDSPPTLNTGDSNVGDKIDWNVISAEIGFTCGFGIAVGSLLFCKRWRMWYYRAMYRILFKIFPQLEHRFGNHRRHVSIYQRFGRR